MILLACVQNAFLASLSFVGRQSCHWFLKMKWVSLIPLNQERILIRCLMKDHLDREEKKRPAHHIMSSSNRMSLSRDLRISVKASLLYLHNVIRRCCVTLSQVLSFKERIQVKSTDGAKLNLISKSLFFFLKVMRLTPLSMKRKKCQ